MTEERERYLNLEIDKVFHTNDIIYALLTDPTKTIEEKTKNFGVIDRLIHTNKATNGAVCNAINLDRQAYKFGLVDKIFDPLKTEGSKLEETTTDTEKERKDIKKSAKGAKNKIKEDKSEDVKNLPF